MGMVQFTNQQGIVLPISQQLCRAMLGRVQYALFSSIGQQQRHRGDAKGFFTE